jgi:hypothetical protein
MAQATENGVRAKVQLKVFEGSTVMMYERNLSAIESCTIGIINGTSISGCSIEIKNIDRTKNSGTFIAHLIDFKSNELKLNLSALANGYIGGGQDGPYLTFQSKFIPNEYQDYLLNLGFYSRTPELAQDYLVRVQVLEWETCASTEACSKFY